MNNISKEQILDIIPQDSPIREKVIEMSDDSLSALSAGLSIYEAAEGTSRDSWFVTLMARLIGRDRQESNSILVSGQDMNTPGSVSEPDDVMRGSSLK